MIKPVTSAPPSPSQSSDSSSMDVSSEGTFGAMLARQVQEKSAAAPNNSAASVQTVQTEANQAEAVIVPDVAIPPASITIASLGKKEIKLPPAKVSSDTKKQDSLAITLPDANSLAMLNYPGILPGTVIQTSAIQAPIVLGSAADKNIQTSPALASIAADKVGASGFQVSPAPISADGISTTIAGNLADKASSLVNPKLVPDSTSAPADDVRTAAGNALPLADGPASNAKLEALTSNAKPAPLPADFSRMLQDAVSAPESKPSPEAMQEAQLAAAQAMMNTRIPSDLAAHAIAAPLNSPAWAGEFSQKVTWLSHDQSQVAELHLNPPDLGPMHVVISVTDNQAMAQFSSPHSEVRHAIENALPKLRESLADNGIMLGNATVSDQTPRDSGAGQFTQQRSRSGNVPTPEPQAISMPAVATRRHTGMLDTFA